MPLQIRRGNTAEINAYTPEPGELIFNSQTTTLSVGNGSAVGGLLVGINAGNAKDAAAAALIAGSHQNISFSYNSVTKAISANVDILAHGTIEADAIDTAAVKDGSTVVLDVANAILYADVVGNISGNVVGNVVGNVTGSIVTNSISSADSSSILCDTPFVFETTLQVQSSLTVEDGGLFTSTNNLSFPLAVAAAHNNDLDTRLVIRRSRGTLTAPASLINNDRLGSIQFNGFDGATFYPAAQIQARVTGAVSPGILPTSLRFLITNTTGVEQESGRFNDAGLFLFANDVSSSPLQIFSGHNSGSNASNVILVRSRGAASVPGTTGTPLAVQNGDPIFDFAFAGYDGTNNTAVAQIRVVTDGAVSAGVVPGRFEFFTSNTLGVSASRLQIATTKTTFNNVPVLPTYADETAADAAIGGSGNRVNGMMYYDTALVKIRAVAGGSYVDLH